MSNVTYMPTPMEKIQKLTIDESVSALAYKLQDIKGSFDSNGVCVTFKVDSSTNIATMINDDQLMTLTHKYGFIRDIPSAKHRDLIAKWKLSLVHAPLPPSFSLDSNEVTFNRIKVAPVVGPTPTWDNFTEKCGANKEALMAYTWSILERTDQSQQFLLLKGEGGDGKGSYTRWLEKILNNQVVALSGGDKHWPAKCVGKRVGCFDDINFTAIVQTSSFKSITGGGSVTIEEKYEKSYSVKLDVKFILTTNNDVPIKSDEANKRRAIIINLSKGRLIENYEELLFEESEAFLYNCRTAYFKLYNKSTKKIDVDYTDFEDEVSNGEEVFWAIFNNAFEVDPKFDCNCTTFINALKKEGITDSVKIGNFKSYIERKFGIKKVRDGSIYKYKGVRCRTM